MIQVPPLSHCETLGKIGLTGADRAATTWRQGNEKTANVIEIGIINNMPDAALRATERQFAGLLRAAAQRHVVHLHFFALPEITRGEAASNHIAANYGGLDELMRASLDGLIVTGKEPRVPSLTAEPYWDSFTKVVDWAQSNTTSTIWSCLAAHAAVLHLDGVKRHTLPRKRFGLFDCATVASDPLLVGAPPSLRVSHSRFNDLAEAELESHGYGILTHSPEAGVDMFVKRWQSLFVFLQGHPEYDPDSLLREYRRDVGRFLSGESQSYPLAPTSYFDTHMMDHLARFEAKARTARDPELMTLFPKALGPSLMEGWHASAIPVFRNWLTYLSANRAEIGLVSVNPDAAD